MNKVLTELSRKIGQEINNSASASNINIDRKTFQKYLAVLEKMYIICPLQPFGEHILSNVFQTNSAKIYLFEPALAIAKLGADTDALLSSTNTFITSRTNNKQDAGFFFEAQVIKQLRVFCSLIGATLSFYRDSNGLEVDCIIRKGIYLSLFEIKLGSLNGIGDGIKTLTKFKSLLTDKQKEELVSCNIITASNLTYYDETNDVNVISINHLFIDEKNI
jgi:predicted AAA+ superfamily ATPase